MQYLIDTLIENAENNNFSLKTIDPRDKAYNEEEDNLLYKEAYTKTNVAIHDLYNNTKDSIYEASILIRELVSKVDKYINNFDGIKTNIHTFIFHPVVPTSLSRILMTKEDILFRTTTDPNNNIDEIDSNVNTFKSYVNKELGISKDFNISDALGHEISVVINSKLIASSIYTLNSNMLALQDDLYASYKLISNKVLETKCPKVLETCVRIFEYICKVDSAIAALYLYACLEIDRLTNVSKTAGTIPIQESSNNEESAKEYLKELDELINEIRDFYDKFEYKEILTPRKKRESKMFEYMLGALDRKYTLKIPIYKVIGVSKETKDIVENKFIKKLETILKKYPNFCVMSPTWDDDDDMFIYITLREPFGDKEDRENREKQTMQEAALTAAQRNKLEDYEFGLPNVRKFPLNDKTHLKEAIKKFGACPSKDKKLLATNIIKRTIYLGEWGSVYVSEENPNKQYFPEWFIGDPAGRYTLRLSSNPADKDLYKIIDDKTDKIVACYKINYEKSINESIILDENGKLY